MNSGRFLLLLQLSLLYWTDVAPLRCFSVQRRCFPSQGIVHDNSRSKSRLKGGSIESKNDGDKCVDIDSMNIREGSQLDADTEREVLGQLEVNMPSDLEIRMQLM